MKIIQESLNIKKKSYGKSCIQQEDSFYQQIGLEFEKEASKILHLERGFVWC
jgi:hypothetical protein